MEKQPKTGGASAIVAINTVKAMRISTGMRRPVLGNRFGGLSRKSDLSYSSQVRVPLYDAVKIPVIGCGGISTADNVIEMMMAGACAVEIGSAVIDDVKVFETIAGDLYAKDGVSPGKIVGCAHG